MAVTAAENPGQSGPRKRTRKPTTLDTATDRPQVTQPGDAPYDTTDPAERATSASFDIGAAAAAGHGTVNAVRPLPEPERPAGPKREDRVETYQVQGPDGKLVSVTHNLDTGETDAD